MKATIRKAACAHPACEGKWIVTYGNCTRRAVTWPLALELARRMMGVM